MLEAYVLMAMFVGFPAACATALGAYLGGKLTGCSKGSILGSAILIGIPAWLFFAIFVLTDEGASFWSLLLIPFLQIGGGSALLSGAGGTAARYMDREDRSSVMTLAGIASFMTSILIAIHVLGTLDFTLRF